MPKIDAESVQAHREQMEAKLIAAADDLLMAGKPLSAKAVAEAVGIARNSLYRYVDSIDELRALVVGRYLPQWVADVETAVAAEAEPLPQLLAYVASNLEAADANGHGRLMHMVKDLNPDYLAPIAEAHHRMAGLLKRLCAELDPNGTVITTAFVQAILEAGFARLDAGDPVDVVRERCTRATQAIVTAAQASAS